MSSCSKRKRVGVDTIDRNAFSFATSVRGTRFCNVEGVTVGEVLQCVRQPDNPFDKNAVGLHRRNAASVRVGYLSRDICSHLTPYLDRKCVTLSVRVVDIQKKGPSSVDIRVDVSGSIQEPCAAETRYEFAKALNEALCPVKGSFSSRILSENAKVMLNDVVRDHSHLLRSEEKMIYKKILALDITATALLLRLYVRKGTWFRMRDLNYFDRETVEAAAEKLIRLEFLQCSAKAPHAKRMTILSSTLSVPEIKKLLRCYRSRNAVCRLQGSKDILMKRLERLLHQVE